MRETRGERRHSGGTGRAEAAQRRSGRVRCGRWAGAIVVLAVAGLAGAGCESEAAKVIRQLHQERDGLKADLQRCTQELADRDAIIATQRRRIENQNQFRDVKLSDLFTTERIEIVSRTGGADYDGQPGDDGVTVYVRPVDGDGDAVKAAGQFVVQLLDLAEAGRPVELSTYIFDDRDTLQKNWYSGFGTNHYTFKCQFPPGRQPSTREVQVRVTFTDWLTGKSMSQSATAEVKRIDAANALVPRQAGPR